MVYITGDRHGHFEDIPVFCERMQTTKDDVLIILGDVGLNYWLHGQDTKQKQMLSKLPITLFCIRGNHEERPENIKGYHLDIFWNGCVLTESEFPNLIFALDGETYDVPCRQGVKHAMVIGGAYSVDKHIRLRNGWGWFKDEQLSTAERLQITKLLQQEGSKVSLILAHTCPHSAEPLDKYLSQVNQDTVDKTMENWMETLVPLLPKNHIWYCGHWHLNRKVGKVQFLYEDIQEL
ncbi:MAG: metallophosphoesterase [Acinetobacter sp.]